MGDPLIVLRYTSLTGRLWRGIIYASCRSQGLIHTWYSQSVADTSTWSGVAFSLSTPTWNCSNLTPSARNAKYLWTSHRETSGLTRTARPPWRYSIFPSNCICSPYGLSRMVTMLYDMYHTAPLGSTLSWGSRTTPMRMYCQRSQWPFTRTPCIFWEATASTPGCRCTS